MKKRILLKEGEFYWLNANGIDPDEPIMIGEWCLNFRGTGRWWVGGQFYSTGPRIEPIRHIPKPRLGKAK